MSRILHIESSKFVHDVVRNIMKKSNNEYIECNSYNEALVILEEDNIDLVLTSTKADGMSVHEFIKEVRYNYKDLRVCIVTGSNNARSLISAGATNYIHKNNLIEEISKYVNEENKAVLESDFLKGKKIAVVDDSPLERLRVKDILSNYTIEESEYFESGIQLFKSKKTFDIYLIDMILKDEYGSNIIGKVKEENPDAIVVAMTALDNEDTLAEVLDYGADDVLVKPLKEKFMISKLKAIVRRK